MLAFQSVLQKTSHCKRLVIAGKVSEIDRGYLDFLHSLAYRLGIAERVDFKINISDAEKLELLEESCILVQPSPVEGFSIVVAEANRCGTPVVVSDGIPGDVVVNGLNGFVYPYGNIDELSRNILKLTEDSVLWKTMSKKAYEWSQKFNWQDSVAEFEKILSEIVQKKALNDVKVVC